jgi:putative SOS response-associated peptidase YedK
MCGRFTLTSDDREWLSAELGVAPDALDDIHEVVIPRFNIAPTQPHWIVRAAGEARAPQRAGWGLVTDSARAADAARYINARAEDVEERPAYRDAFRFRRCVVPADGFYEWTAAPGARRRPFWFHRADRGLLRFAGLYAEPVAGPAPLATFTILTTAAGPDVAPVHDRMPVILPDDAAVDAWLYDRQPPDALRALLAPLPAGALARRAVSPRVNTVAHDAADCLDEAEDALQGSLFGP